MTMTKRDLYSRYTPAWFRAEACRFLDLVRDAGSLEEARRRLYVRVSEAQFERSQDAIPASSGTRHVARDCARALRAMLDTGADKRAGVSIAQTMWDLATGRERPDLQPGFYAELGHLVAGVEGRASVPTLDLEPAASALTGRARALERSDHLDALWGAAAAAMARYPDGLTDDSQRRRAGRRAHILAALSATEADFSDWRWQVSHVAREAETLARLACLSEAERDQVRRARRGTLPFGVTPYYASLFDDDPAAGRDRALRAQVIPPANYVSFMLAHRGDRSCAFDFMLEHETSPVDLITRRYPAICILKPFNTCPQICVYCQRNWEIDDAMAPGALASPSTLDGAIEFLEQHPAICEVLVTGGDPLGMPDDTLLPILRRVAAIRHVDLIRIGTRTPVTLPMRITPELAAALGALREPGRREICVMTHVENAYEVTPETVLAVDRLKRHGISVYNQLVYTFFVSRRFEAARLRLLLRRIGIDPYYTFLAKGKEETSAYRVPLARLVQEQQEEARLLPGLRRADEAVYNVPGLGKSYLRAVQHRDLIGIQPDGARVYDFHPWEKGIKERESYTGTDVPVLDYLAALEQIGEDAGDYASIWYYF